MPKLTDFRPVKEITLPSYPDSKVEIFGSLLVGDTLSLSKADFGKIKEGETPTEDMLLQFMDVLPKLIKSWNFTDNNEQPLLVTRENLGFLKAEDLIFMLQQITEFVNESKKK